MKNIRLRYLLRERDVRGHRGEMVLSVYRDHGVIPKAERSDNYNKTPEDLGNYKLVLPGDVVVNKMKAWQGSLAISPYRGIVSGDYLVCAVTADLDLSYLHHLLRGRPLIAEYAARAKGIRPQQWRLYWEDFADITILLPPLPQQILVGQFLDAEMVRINGLIGQKSRMIALLHERQASETYRRITEVDAPMRSVAMLARYINGYPFKPDEIGSNGLPIVRIRQLVEENAEFDHFAGYLPSRYIIDNGDLIFSWSGSLEVRIWNRGRAYLNQHLFRVFPNPGIDRDWLRFALDVSTRAFSGLMHGSAMTHITRPMMKQVRLPVPSEEEQRVEAQRLAELWSKIGMLVDRLDRQILLLKEHRQALISHATAGHLDIPGAAV